MIDFTVANIICFQTKKQLATLNNIRVLLKGVLIDLRARTFGHAKTFLLARCVHARHRARNLSSPDLLYCINVNLQFSFPEKIILNRELEYLVIFW